MTRPAIRTDRPAETGPANAIQAPGTDEAQWRDWSGWDAMPPALLPERGRVVVVAAHPDDEVLGFGGAMAVLAARGVRLTVVSITDGEGSHPDSRVVTPPALARLRARELRAALTELGAGQAEIIRLGVPDTGVADHEEQLVDALTPLARGADLVAAPWTGDVHSDHEAAGRAARTAALRSGTPLSLYPVWMWHWARPDDPRVPWRTARCVQLPPHVQALKQVAIDRFTTQIHPLGPGPEDAAVLPPEELAHHLRPTEVLFQ
ncbi:PIG-L family deacetylase [Streptomyces kunmingensis]|uniref:PIG-L family deacetylase n=1 Tax=Streptomyces kunmingensis TaxID=68225 RepID=A0ABU6CA48_9ACTN|nr:PIG-L family deacetylase [Streptomyces kunmingensis]MEB3961584.1 PIG-L family deacetylase [Streptomyces kunmingensis]